MKRESKARQITLTFIGKTPDFPKTWEMVLGGGIADKQTVYLSQHDAAGYVRDLISGDVGKRLTIVIEGE